MTLCFTTLDGYYKLVSFDIDLSGIDKNYAVKGIRVFSIC